MNYSYLFIRGLLILLIIAYSLYFTYTIDTQEATDSITRGLIGSFLMSLGIAVYFASTGRLMSTGSMSQEGNYKVISSHWYGLLIGLLFLNGALSYLIVGEGTVFGYRYYAINTFYQDNIFSYFASGFLMGIGCKLLSCSNGMGMSGVLKFNNKSILSVCLTLFAIFSLSNLRMYNDPIGYTDSKSLDAVSKNYKGYNSYINDCSNGTQNENNVCLFLESTTGHTVSGSFVIIGSIALVVYLTLLIMWESGLKKCLKELACALVATIILGQGVLIAGLGYKHKTIDFGNYINPNYAWDPGFGLIVLSFLTFNDIMLYIVRTKMVKPLTEEIWRLDEGNQIDTRFVLGTVSFALGYGFLGICPLTAIMNAHHYMLTWTMIVGVVLGQFFTVYINKQIDIYKEFVKEYMRVRKKSSFLN